MKRIKYKRHLLKKEIFCSCVGSLGVTLCVFMVFFNDGNWQHFAYLISANIVVLSFIVLITCVFCSFRDSVIKNRASQWLEERRELNKKDNGK